jgi:DNA primase
MSVKAIKIKVYPPMDDSKLIKAKQYQIEEIYKGATRKTGKILMGICPIHKESTPSFAIYPKTNTCYCFACGFGGDSVSLYMKLNNCDFKQAIEELTK